MALNDRGIEARLAGVAALAEPVRRALYEYVSHHGPEVGREQAARGLKIPRALAAFHLDRLVEAGLLSATFRRLTGRSGPGAGRPSKLYTRSSTPLEVSLPRTRYELAGRLLARAVLAGDSASTAEALGRAAAEHGARLASQVRARAGKGAGAERLLRGVLEILGEEGFEPQLTEEEGLVLRNCPFRALQIEFKELICGMNLALIEGLVAGLRHPGLSARLLPAPGRCCVVIRSRGRTRG